MSCLHSCHGLYCDPEGFLRWSPSLLQHSLCSTQICQSCHQLHHLLVCQCLGYHCTCFVGIFLKNMSQPSITDGCSFPSQRCQMPLTSDGQAGPSHFPMRRCQIQCRDASLPIGHPTGLLAGMPSCS